MPKATFSNPEAEVLASAPFQTPRKVGDLDAWYKAANKALGNILPLKANITEDIITQGSIVMVLAINGQTGVLVIDRHHPFRLTGKF